MEKTVKLKNTRNAAATKERILLSAITEFGSKGYGGARIVQIAERANCNIRMIYHYFENKHILYLACLEHVYTDIRKAEQDLQLNSLEPLEAIQRLVEFTFDHMSNHPDFVRLAGAENTEGGQYIKEIPALANAADNLIETIDQILDKGKAKGTLRKDIDAFQLYISILSLSYLHLSNQHTLSVTYGRSLTDKKWLATRRTHVSDMIMAYVKL